MGLRKYRSSLDDLWQWANEFSVELPTRSWTWRGQWVDTDRYDIVEKPEYRKELTEQKDKELKELDSYYERKKKELLNERDRLLGLKSG